jgi:hypothetical protein
MDGDDGEMTESIVAAISFGVDGDSTCGGKMVFRWCSMSLMT